MSCIHMSLYHFTCPRSLPARSLLLLFCILLSSRNIDSVGTSSGLGGGVAIPTTGGKNPTHASRGRANASPGMTRNIEEENGPPVLSESIMGTIGRLPCNVTPPILEDRVALVIWYKVGLKTPIYSVDTRDSNFTQGTHWSDETYRDRLTFNVEGRAGTLAIKSTVEEDTGEYRCRVDFQKSPTRNSKVNLTVITPPESIIILDSRGATIKEYTLGPYNEGSMVNITCVAIGGRPQPKVTWWHDNKPLHSSTQSLSDRRVANVLSLGKLKRKNLHMQLTCQAANNNLTVPITSTVTLDMNLRPLIVKLQGENRPLSAENSYQLSCVVIGSRPAPTVTWWKGSTSMKNTHEITNPDGNTTTSILTFTPTIDDRGKFLSCRAEQSMIPESGMEDGWKLDIYHIPVVTLELGTNSINSTLREGIDVFFECNIKSNPWIYQVSWRHNGNILENNIAEGIIVANQSLVLQNISRARSGIYTCVGSNREGDGESNPVQLEIKFAPVCRAGQRTSYSSGRHETVKIACEIEANPTDASYIWKFNATQGETVDIPASLIAIDRGRSVAHYTPMTENDYGTLLCWASNEIGDQSEPCVYTISPAGEPDPLVNCTLLNQTSTGFQIECIEGFDGGLQQDFIMEVYVNGTTRHPKIYKSKTPYFEVRGLVPGIGYNVFLVAHNNKGRSNATILQVYTLKNPEKQTVVITYTKTFEPRLEIATSTTQYAFPTIPPNLSTITTTEADDCLTTIATQTVNDKNLSLAYVPVIEDIRPFLVVLAGIVISLFFVSILIVIVVRLRGSAGHDRNNYSHPVHGAIGVGNNNNGNLGINGSGLLAHNGAQSAHDGTIHRVVRDGTCHVTSSLDSIDKNPDIIPQDGRDDDDEWTTKGHNRAYATAALAEQNAVISSTTYDHIMPTYAVVDKNSQQAHLQQLPKQQQQPHNQYIQYNTLIPVGKMSSYATSQQQHQHQQQQQQQQHQHQQQLQQNKTELSYPELSTPLVASGSGTSVQRMSPYCSATLGRPRQTDLKRAEPNIYSQIDLAHHPMYTTSPLFGASVSTGSSVGVASNATMTGVTMSHPSQLATFAAPPPIFASHHNVVTATHAAVAAAAAAANNGLMQSRGGVCMTLPAVTLHAVQTSSGAAAAAAAAAASAVPTQHQHTQSALSVATDECSNVGNGAGNGSIVGVGMSVYGDVQNGKSNMLKAVPEELHINGEDVMISQERNNATRF